MVAGGGGAVSGDDCLRRTLRWFLKKVLGFICLCRKILEVLSGVVNDEVSVWDAGSFYLGVRDGTVLYVDVR